MPHIGRLMNLSLEMHADLLKDTPRRLVKRGVDAHMHISDTSFISRCKWIGIRIKHNNLCHMGWLPLVGSLVRRSCRALSG